MISLNILRATEKTSTGRIQMKEDDKTILYNKPIFSFKTVPVLEFGLYIKNTNGLY